MVIWLRRHTRLASLIGFQPFLLVFLGMAFLLVRLHFSSTSATTSIPNENNLVAFLQTLDFLSGTTQKQYQQQQSLYFHPFPSSTTPSTTLI